jgi:hypothetical protein
MSDKSSWATYDGLADERPLPELCRDFFASQMTAWPALRLAHENLKSARLREISGNDFTFFLQFNPGRTASAEARIDMDFLASRPCFLCPEQRPVEQRAILYRRSVAILCNPFPIFTPHFTIAHLHHLPQAIDDNMDRFLELARDMSPGFSVFYNGPACGASAPDHLHFQGSPSGAVPVERENITNGGTFVKRLGDDVSFFIFNRPGRHFLYLEGADRQTLAYAAGLITEVLRELTDEDTEPMVNIIASFAGARWRLYFFPRCKHRPSAFFLAGDDRRAITPGAVEMGGLVITTRERDFNMLDRNALLEIFSEVSVDRAFMKRVVDTLLAGHG